VGLYTELFMLSAELRAIYILSLQTAWFNHYLYSGGSSLTGSTLVESSSYT